MFEIYNVCPGESINSIADNFGVAADYLYKINGFEADRNLKGGDNIIVPRPTSEYFKYSTMKEGKKLADLAREKNVDPNLLALLNGINLNDYVYPNQVLILPKEDVKFYITKENDTFNKVVKTMKADPARLAYINNKLYLREEQLIIYKDK